MKTLLIVMGILLLTSFATAQSVYTETESYQIEVLEDGQLQVRKAMRVFKDGNEIAKTYHRHVLVPGSNITNEVQRVKNIANVVWTKDIIEQYRKDKIEREKEMK